MKTIKGLIFWGIIILIAGSFACYQSKELDLPQESHKSSPHKLKILTTIAPLYSFTKNIVEDCASVDNLLPSGVGPHEYSLSPEDMKKIVEAQLIIKNGVGLERWLDKLILQEFKRGEPVDRNKRKIVDTSKGIEVINGDPHIWLSPRNAVIQVKNIKDALIKADPDNSETYTNNADEYIKRLKNLDREITDEVNAWKRKDFVAFHSAFVYFSRDYGLEQVAVIQEFPEKQPTPQHIAELINIIKIRDIKVIFTEPQASQKLVQSIAKDLQLQVLTLDTLETGDLYPEWYEVRMRANLEVLNMVFHQDVLPYAGSESDMHERAIILGKEPK